MNRLLRKRIEILSAAREADEAGGAALAWTTLETVWAGLKRLAGTRETGGEGRVLRRRLAATARFRIGVLPGQRARIDGTDYEIVSVETDDGKERFMTLVCEEVL